MHIIIQTCLHIHINTYMSSCIHPNKHIGLHSSIQTVIHRYLNSTILYINPHINAQPIHPSLHGLSARWCPMSLTSSLSEFLMGYRPCWCPSPFPSPSIFRCFSIHSSSPAIGFHSCFCFTDDVSAHIRSTLHLLTFCMSFQACDWLWYPMLWSQGRNRSAHGAEISIQIPALPGEEPRTLASSGRERYR